MEQLRVIQISDMKQFLYWLYVSSNLFYSFIRIRTLHQPFVVHLGIPEIKFQNKSYEIKNSMGKFHLKFVAIIYIPIYYLRNIEWIPDKLLQLLLASYHRHFLCLIHLQLSYLKIILYFIHKWIINGSFLLLKIW